MKDDVVLVKDVVKDVLESDVRLRDDDKYLIVTVLRRMGFDVFIPYKKMEAMPSFESITRCRRKLQEQGLYPPSPKTEDERKKEETKMRKIESWF